MTNILGFINSVDITKLVRLARSRFELSLPRTCFDKSGVVQEDREQYEDDYPGYPYEEYGYRAKRNANMLTEGANTGEQNKPYQPGYPCSFRCSSQISWIVTLVDLGTYVRSTELR